jgi:Flp pilus assembly pilin Flp
VKFKFRNRKGGLKRPERGATAVEYGLLVGLLAIGIITATATMRSRMTATFGTVFGYTHVFAPEDFLAYVSTPTVSNGIVNLTAAAPNGINFDYAAAWIRIPEIKETGELKWGLLACSPNSPSLNIAVTLGGGVDFASALSANIPAGTTYAWTQSSPVSVQAGRPNGWVRLNGTGQTMKVRQLVLGAPKFVDQWITEHPYTGPCV